MFGKKTIDSVIGDLSTKVGHLRELAEVHHSTAQTHLSQAQSHEDQATVHAMERDRATRIAAKFEELLN